MTNTQDAHGQHLVLMDGNLRWHEALPVFALLLVQVGLYVWMAPRGFEFSDESLYLLGYLYWRDLLGTVSFYAAYLEFPFRMLGQSVAAIRIFTVVLLLASSAFCLRESLHYWLRRQGSGCKTPWAAVAVGMAASLFYFGYLRTLRAPSYNLLVLCSMLVSTGSLLRLLNPALSMGHARAAALLCGLAVGVCGLNKATSGVLLLAAHALFFALANHDWRFVRLRRLLVWSLAGTAANLIVLHLAQPTWPEMLLRGVEATALKSSHDLATLTAHLGRDVKTMAVQVLPLIFFAEVALFLLTRWSVPGSRSPRSLFVVAVLAGCVGGLMHWWLYQWWQALLGVTFLMFWSIEVWCRKPEELTRSDVTDLVFAGLLFALPLAYSFGTDMPVLRHSQMAAVFPVAAVVLQLQRLAQLGLLARPGLAACLAALCLPTLQIQSRAATELKYTYRQFSPLGQQRLPVPLGPKQEVLLVDTQTREILHSITAAARAAGFAAGDAILDFTGDFPGLAYALGGRPVGSSWLIGGYPGSEAMAAYVLGQLPPETLRRSWLLSSENSPRAIKIWHQILAARVGSNAHGLVATVNIRAPYRRQKDDPETLAISLWKPPEH